jgi:prepilin-type N-terminal cleavage/methylation domain-containing protein
MKSLVQGLVNKSKKKQKGMTLVELLAVIVILGIVAAIGTVAIGGIISKSKKDADLSSRTMIIEAAKLYALANNINEATDGAALDIQTVLIGGGYLELKSLTPQSSTTAWDDFTITASNATGTYTVALTPDPVIP